jgi:DNA-binding beta-propeller fold protein YncE
MRLRRWLCAALVSLLGCSPPAPPAARIPPPPGRVYVAHAFGTVSALDPAARSLMILGGRYRGLTSVEAALTDFAATPDGGRGFASSRGQDLVYAVDLYDGRTLATIAVPGGPEGLAIGRRGRRVYVTTTRPALAVIDTVDLALTGEIPLDAPAGDAAGIARSRHGDLIAVLTQNRTLAVVDTASESAIRMLPLGGAPVALTITADGRRAWVAGFPAGAVALVDLSSGDVVDALPIGGRPRGVVATADGRWVYVADAALPTVSVFDTAPGGGQRSISVRARVSALEITRDGDFVIAVHADAHRLSVIATATRSVIYAMEQGTLPAWPVAIAVP